MSYFKEIRVGSDLISVEVSRDPVSLRWVLRLRNGRDDISGERYLYDKKGLAEEQAREVLRSIARDRVKQWESVLLDLAMEAQS